MTRISDDRQADFWATVISIYGLLITGCVGIWGWN